MKHAAQIVKCAQIGIWQVAADAPTRNVHGVLAWQCECASGHIRMITNGDLSYSVVPARCSKCMQEAAALREAAQREERIAAQKALDRWYTEQKVLRTAKHATVVAAEGAA